VQLVRDAAICPACEGLRVPAAQYEEREEQQRRRRKSMFEEAGEIFVYPLTDATAFVLRVLVVWIFTVMRGLAGMSMGGLVALLFSKGLLMAYAFNAVNRAANGQFRGFMPSINGMGDLVAPLWAGFLALVSSSWPLILAGVLYWQDVALNIDPEAAPEPRAPRVRRARAGLRDGARLGFRVRLGRGALERDAAARAARTAPAHLRGSWRTSRSSSASPCSRRVKSWGSTERAFLAVHLTRDAPVS
jgi:hypothetical protein